MHLPRPNNRTRSHLTQVAKNKAGLTVATKLPTRSTARETNATRATGPRAVVSLARSMRRYCGDRRRTQTHRSARDGGQLQQIDNITFLGCRIIRISFRIPGLESRLQLRRLPSCLPFVALIFLLNEQA